MMNKKGLISNCSSNGRKDNDKPVLRSSKSAVELPTPWFMDSFPQGDLTKKEKICFHINAINVVNVT